MATRVLILFLLCPLFAGCMTVVTTAGEQGGYIASQERSTGDAASDARIRLFINDKLFQYSTDVFGEVNLTVVEGHVLLTGNVMHAKDRVKAVELVWQRNSGA